MQDKVALEILIIAPLKRWECLDIWDTTLTVQNSVQEEIKSRFK
jgi:hypothetical protein